MQFKAGDKFIYESLTMRKEVTWTRGSDGNWHADDERADYSGGYATDEQIEGAMFTTSFKFIRALDPHEVLEQLNEILEQ